MRNFLIAVLLTLGLFAQPAISGPSQERYLLFMDTWAAQPQNRETLTPAYWAMVQEEVDILVEKLPVALSQITLMVNVELVGKTVIYEYISQTARPTEYDLQQFGRQALGQVCEGVLQSFLIGEMEGELEFRYYNMESPEPYILIANAKTCGYPTQQSF